MSRFLGIDYGARRIGLAVGDSTTRLASPIRTLRSSGEGAQAFAMIRQIIDEFGITALVVGLPLNMDGTEGLQAKRTRAFGDTLATSTSLPLHYQDERLSSFTADELLESTGAPRSSQQRAHDAVAAQVILQAFLDREGADESPSRAP